MKCCSFLNGIIINSLHAQCEVLGTTDSTGDTDKAGICHITIGFIHIQWKANIKKQKLSTIINFTNSTLVLDGF